MMHINLLDRQRAIYFSSSAAVLPTTGKLWRILVIGNAGVAGYYIKKIVTELNLFKQN